MDNNCENFRNTIMNEPRVFGPNISRLRTTMGSVPSAQGPPPVPPRPYCPSQAMMYNQMSPYSGGMYGAGGLMGTMGGMLGGFGGGYGAAGYSGGFGGYNRYGGGGMYGGGGYGAGYGAGAGYGGGMNPSDPEQRFIQLAEETSRPAFQSIESLVMAFGNIASMLDSTFFALTNSFRAVLGVAANFGRLRSVFAQFWSTFALFRAITWMYRK